MNKNRTHLNFSFTDLFKALRLAFSPQRIWIQFIGLTIGYAGYFVFAVFSLLLSGESFSDIIARYGLFPCLLASRTDIPVVAYFVFALGSLIFFIAAIITNTAVARASFMVLKRNNFYSWRNALAFGLRKSGSTLVPLLVLLTMVLGLVVGAWVVGFLGRIPFIGELGVSLFTFFWMLATLLLIFLGIATMTAILMMPAIIATTNEDAFEGTYQTFSVIWNQPWRTLFYTLLATAISVVGFFILAIFVKQAFVLMNGLFSFSMSDKYINLASQGQYLLQSWTNLLNDGITKLFGEFRSLFFFGRNFIPLELNTTLAISSYIFAISMVIVGGLTLSYLLAIFNTASVISYLILRKRKDDENVLDWKDKEVEGEDEEPGLTKELESDELVGDNDNIESETVGDRTDLEKE